MYILYINQYILDEQNMEIEEIPIFSNISFRSMDQLSDRIGESSICNSPFASEDMSDYTPQRLITTPL